MPLLSSFLIMIEYNTLCRFSLISDRKTSTETAHKRFGDMSNHGKNNKLPMAKVEVLDELPLVIAADACVAMRNENTHNVSAAMSFQVQEPIGKLLWEPLHGRAWEYLKKMHIN
ncbi:unnamed protein product [Triticum turgidum subsp. durum]|uniref:Uncharacterized protein n=1 Tax=Triticum turgidum subsp. durum TaxID=4567 RepID=A0A9R1AFG1_TRITD|nr:unnamed protein product [Triticum turgidum subsp. durum]